MKFVKDKCELLIHLMVFAICSFLSLTAYSNPVGSESMPAPSQTISTPLTPSPSQSIQTTDNLYNPSMSLSVEVASQTSSFSAGIESTSAVGMNMSSTASPTMSTSTHQSTVSIAPTPTPVPSPMMPTGTPDTSQFQTNDVAVGSRLFNYAINHCDGELYRETVGEQTHYRIYHLKNGGDFGRAVFERLPDDLNLLNQLNDEGPGDSRNARRRRQVQPELEDDFITLLSFSFLPETTNELIWSDLADLQRVLTTPAHPELDSMSIAGNCNLGELNQQGLERPDCAYYPNTERVRPISSNARNDIYNRLISMTSTINGGLTFEEMLQELTTAVRGVISSGSLPFTGGIRPRPDDEDVAGRVLILMDSGQAYRATVLPYFVFDRFVRVGLCGVDSRLFDEGDGTATMAPPMTTSVASTSIAPTMTSVLVPSATPFMTPADRPDRAQVDVFADRNSIFLDINMRITSYGHLDNAELLLNHIHINGNTWPSGLYPFFPDEGFIIGNNVKLTRTQGYDSVHNQDIYGLFQTYNTTIELRNSELDYGLDWVGLFLTATGSLTLIDSTYRMRGARTNGIASWFTGTESFFDNVHFVSYDPDTSPTAFETVYSRDQVLTFKNSKLSGPFNPALRISNTRITDDSINNDDSELTGTLCRHFGDNFGSVIRFTSGATCPLPVPTQPPRPSPSSEEPGETDPTAEMTPTQSSALSTESLAYSVLAAIVAAGMYLAGF